MESSRYVVMLRKNRYCEWERVHAEPATTDCRALDALMERVRSGEFGECEEIMVLEDTQRLHLHRMGEITYEC